MTESKTKTSRRAFFVSGGAVLGAGAAAAVSAAPVASESTADDRETIRRLHLDFAGFMEQRRYEAAADLFAEAAQLDLSGVAAKGKSAIAKLLAHRYRDQDVPVLHSAYRQNASQRLDAVTLGKDGTQATAIFHTEVELCTPLQADCTAATMARLQGNVADRR